MMSLHFLWTILVVSILLTSCASNQIGVINSGDVDKKTNNILARNSDYTVFPGELVKLDLPMVDDLNRVRLRCGDKEYLLFKGDNYIHTYLSESYFSNLKPYKCYYLFDGKSEMVAQIKVMPKTYKSERLHVDKKRIDLSKKDIERVTREKEIIKMAYAKGARTPLFNDPFASPLNSKITSYYGTRRVYNNKKKSQHLGIDFRANVGEPIPVANHGKVILAQDLFFTGNTVIVDHGAGIFTTYGHLSKINVQEGEIVPPLTIVGLAGATGRVTGPHLHWGVKVGEEWVNGFSLVNVTSLTK